MKKKRLLKWRDSFKSPQKMWQVIRLSFLFCVLWGMNLSASVYSQQNKVSLNLKDVTLEEFIEAVRQQTGVSFLYNASLFAGAEKVSVEVRQEALDKVLKELLTERGFVFDYQNDVVVIKKGEFRQAAPEEQKKIVRGTVKDKNGDPLPGVSVIIKGTSSGVATDIDGNYEIKVDNRPDVVLLFSFVGMNSREIKTGNQDRWNVVLEYATENLDEVVVTGYQTISRERATGSYAVVTSKDYENKLQENVMDRMEGMVAGLVSYNDKVYIRGISTIYGNKEPLYVVDGMPYEGSIDAINPADVTNITVLKDATAASIYGARAANGVIVITTRRGNLGESKPLTVSYNGSVKFTPLPDLDYLDKANSSELIDVQIGGFNYYHSPTYNKRRALNEITDLLYQQERGEISSDEMNRQIDAYRKLDRHDQVKDEWLRTAIKHQHNFSISGGTEKNAYMASINYLGNSPYEKTLQERRVGFNLKDNMRLTDWLTAELGVSGSFTRDGGNNGLSAKAQPVGPAGVPYLGAYGIGQAGALSMYTGGPSYLMLRNADGTPREFRKNKSDEELDRLQSIGLNDETFIPVEEMDRATRKDRSSYYRLQAAFQVKIIEGLTVDLKYQTEGTSVHNRQLFSKDSWYVRNMVNEAAVYDAEAGEITRHVPEGGQIQDSRADIYSYTMRGQINFDRMFKEVHAVNVIAGGERRLVRTTATNVYRMGYDDNSLSYKPYNPLIMNPVSGTESVYGSFDWVDEDYNNFYSDEDRYVSFYGNASYTYNDRYALTGSIRVDQSNLFGTDPKYQYKPLWSVGASWYVASESFMENLTWLNRLNLRLTYGINGNISKETGPYLTVVDEGYNSWTGDFAASIQNPPNPELRWEKTAVTNIGMDFAVLDNRLSGSVEYYNKKSTDLLGKRSSDPTLGWTSLLQNYGSMYNRGVEFTLNSVNIQKDNFEWTSVLNFSYNKNKILDIQDTDTRVFNLVNGTTNMAGRPVNSLFSYRSAGLDPENGKFMVYDENGEKKTNVQSVEALVYSGTTIPPYSLSFSNQFSYKGFSLSFMFIYNGGHVLRDAVDFLTGTPSSNIYKRSLNYWKQPGDENKPGVIPAMNRSANYQTQQVWYAADENVLKADYIKLRELTLSYRFPKNLLNRWNIDNMALNLQINNLWRWSANDRDIDPEAYTTVGYGQGSRTLPLPTTYTLGLSFNL